MKRMHLLEFCDQPWLPAFMREAFHDCIGFNYTLFKPYKYSARALSEFANAKQVNTFLDLASGGATHITTISDEMRRQSKQAQFVASDLFPHQETWRQIAGKLGHEYFSYIPTPVSITDIPQNISRHWTIFTAFHHFKPEMARLLLTQAFDKADSLHIMEYTHRSPIHFLMLATAFPLFLLAPFASKRFTLPKFLVTTLIPIVPLMAVFDGAVSCLRSYTYEEILALMPQEMDQLFDIEYRQPHIPATPAKTVMVSFIRKQTLA